MGRTACLPGKAQPVGLRKSKKIKRSSNLSSQSPRRSKSLQMVPNVTAILRKQADANWPSLNQRRHELHGNEARAAFTTFAAFQPDHHVGGRNARQISQADG